MFSLTRMLCGSLSTALAFSLPLAIATFSPSAFAQSAPQQQPQKGAAALGGALTPSNEALFQTPPRQKPAQRKSETLKVDRTSAVNENTPTPLNWQSEHLDTQRQSSSGFSFVNVDLD